MDTLPRVVRIFGIIGLVMSVTACNQDGSPTGPSSDLAPSSAATSAPPPSFNVAPSSGAMIQGKVTNLAGLNGLTSLSGSGLTTSVTVKVVGTNITAPVSPTGAFVLEGVPAGNVKLEFTGGASTQIGNVKTGDRIDIQVRITGSTGVVESAVQIRPDNTTFVDGTVTSVSGSCPNRTIVVNGWTLTLTNSNQGTCPDLKIGVKIKITGNFTSGKTIVIVKIEVLGSKKSDDKDSDDDSDSDSDSDSDGPRRLFESLVPFDLNW